MRAQWPRLVTDAPMVKMTMRRPLLRLFGLVALLYAQPAWANEFDDFQQARSAYEAADYNRALALFSALVGGEVPRLQNHSLVLESLKYLGATHLFLGQTEQSEELFRRLLKLDRDYVLDPLAFPEEVQKVFARVKAELEVEVAAQREAELSAREQQVQREQARAAAEAERMRELVELARTERVEVRNSRWLALLPFGIGQFQNGHEGLGYLLLISETLLTAAVMTTYVAHQSISCMSSLNANVCEDARFAERAYRYGNQASAGALALVAIAGILDAQIRFTGNRSTERQRRLPAHLEPPVDLSFTGTGLRVRF